MDITPGYRVPKWLIGCTAMALGLLAIVTVVWISVLKRVELNMTVGWKGDNVSVFNTSLAPILITHLSTMPDGRLTAELPKPILMPSHTETEIPTSGLTWKWSPAPDPGDPPKPGEDVFIVYQQMRVKGRSE